MMKLLPKTKIASLKSDERKKEIEEGAKLARTVDALRQVKGKEEANLAKFREQTLLVVKDEIIEKVNYSRLLDAEIAHKKEERLKLEAPIDLTESWNEVNALKQVLQDREIHILSQGTQLIERESTVEAKTEELSDRDEKLKELENLTSRYNAEAQKNYDLSVTLKLDTENEKKKTEANIHERYHELSAKEQEFGYRERDLISSRESLENDRKEIEKEKLHIISQQQTLKVAWENLKKLRK